jgi:dihydrolipoamide dehydrogenase
MASKHIVVIGAGVAGISAAQAAAGAGARVTVVAGNEPAGGRATWHSLLPSKVLLTVADSLGQARRFSTLGLTAAGEAPDMPATARRIRDLSESWSRTQSAQLSRLGVRLLEGTATFAGHGELHVSKDGGAPAALAADAIIVATGSIPTFPPDLKPDGKRIIAPRFIRKLERLPASLVVVGAGVTGAEFVYAFNRLGVAVSWVVDEYGVLPTFDREAAAFLVKTLESRGVVRHDGVAAASVASGDDVVKVTLRDGRTISAEMAFLALGRRPDVAALNLENAGLHVDPRRGVEVDEFCCSAVRHVYAAGDATGMPLTANKAMAQGWIAGRHAAGAASPPYHPGTIVEAVYTDPEVAQIGLLETQAAAQGHALRVLHLDHGMNLKAVLAGEPEGFMKLVVDAGDGTVLGAAAVGTHAADVLAPLALGIRLKARVDDLVSLFPAHPGLGEIAFAAARAT